MLQGWRTDCVFALRQLGRSRGFAITAIVTLALGIGATTAVYSLVDGVLLQPLQAPHPEQLMAVHTLVKQPGEQPSWVDTSWPDYLDWRAKNHTFSGLAAIVGDHRLVSRKDGTGGIVTGVNRVSPNYFDVVGAQPAMGRTFAESEERAGVHVAILGYGLWQRMLGGNPRVLGQTILLSDEPYTVIGVMPRDFVEPQAETAELWVNIALLLEGSAPTAKMRDRGIAGVLGRLKPGVTREQAEADLGAIQAGLEQSYPEIRYESGVVVRSQLEEISGYLQGPLTMLMAAVLAVLLIVCTNVAGLMLTRAMGRSGEVALRTALGASQWRVWRQLLIESLVLAACGGALGAGMAWALLRMALPWLPDDLPRVDEVGLNGRVLCFVLAISLLCAVMSSVAPAWRLRRVSPMDALREQGRNATAGRRHGTLQNALVVVQTTLGVALLVAAGYLIRGFVNVREVDTGFRPQHLLEFMLPLTQVRYPDAKKAVFYEALLPKLAALPGVSMASGGYPLPLFGHFASATVEVDGRPNPPGHELSTLVGSAEPGFFETLGVPLLRGRLFTRGDDDPRAPLVAVVNQAFAKRYFAGLDPIGRRIRPDLRELRNQAKDVDPTGDAEREIVGVIADVREDSLLDPPEPFAVFPYAQASAMMRPTVLLRVTGDPMRYEKAAVVAGMDPTLFLLAPRSVETIMGNRTATQRFETWLIAGFSGIALFLMGLGFYSMLATMVVSRTREIGVRMAIGADRRDVAGLVLTRATMLLASGAAVGGIAAVVALRVVKSSDWSQELLFGVSGSDPRILMLTAAVLAIVAVCGCLLPTLRATRIDPARALRDE